jgi:hypothetical protein
MREGKPQNPLSPEPEPGVLHLVLVPSVQFTRSRAR